MKIVIFQQLFQGQKISVFLSIITINITFKNVEKPQNIYGGVLNSKITMKKIKVCSKNILKYTVYHISYS